jgi:uncharacterized damage-inducible protein DinB
MPRMDPLRVYEYLATARARLLGWIRPLTPEQYTSEHPIGLGSLARTLHHVRAAEWHYMERLRGRTEPIGDFDPENDPEVGTDEALPFDALERLWDELASRTHADLAAVSDWTTPRLYTTNWEGRPHTYRASAGDFFAQLALHEVHHRAQALHMLRRLGVETEDIDYNALMWTPAEPG